MMPQRLACLVSVGVLFCAGFDGYAGAPSQQRMTPLVRAIQRARPSVVNIHSQKTVPAQSLYTGVASPASKMSGMGTGVIIDERGYVVTNYHVIEDVTSIRATLVDGTTFPARVVARDPETDLALLKIDPTVPLSVMLMGASDDLMHGETVVAIGNAFGYEHTITQGIISELHRDVRLSADQAYRDLIQTDASINPGNSGGPLLNADGEMVGLNVAIRAGAQGIGFAIPVDEVKRVVAKLLGAKSVGSTWHGLTCIPAPATENTQGRVIVQKVEPGSPAERSGIKIGDRLLNVGGMVQREPFDIERTLLEKKSGQQVPVVVLRDGRETKLTLVLANSPIATNQPQEVAWKKIGVRLTEEPATTEVRRVSTQLQGGLRVTEVADASPASKAGIVTGDVLVGLDQWETLNLDNVNYVLTRKNLLDKPSIQFYLVREGQIHRGWLQLARD